MVSMPFIPSFTFYMKKALIFFWLFIFTGTTIYSQSLKWTGEANNGDFFDENNWLETDDGTIPDDGTIDPDKAINRNLSITNNGATVTANGTIVLGTGKLYIKKALVNVTALAGGNVEVDINGYIDISSSNPLRDDITIDLLSGIAWLRTLNISTSVFRDNYISNIKVKGEQSNYHNNLRIDNYYLNGAVVRANISSAGAVKIFKEPSFNGDSASLEVNIIYRGDAIPGNLHNKISSLKLSKGYQLVVAQFPDGTGLSKVFIASEDDMKINNLGELNDVISFIRVIPWNWSVKKGTGGNISGLNTGWFYNWSSSGYQNIYHEYVPMAWGAKVINDESDIDVFTNKYKATHALGFNEPDDCNEQSGQYNNLCNTDIAIKYYQNLMKTGLRIVSPACHENQVLGWLKTFNNKAKDKNIRIDVIAVHWYDWASSPASSPNADPKKVFNRFKTYLQNVYNYYHLPMWITEFNANPNRTTYVNNEFMKLALPYLENLSYIERYAWFQPSSGVANFYDGNGNLTETGNIYKNNISTPAVSERTLICRSNTDGNTTKAVRFYDYFEEYYNNQNLTDFYTSWNGNSLAVDDDVTTDYGTAFDGNGFGRADINGNDYYLRKTFLLEAGTTYEWSLATKAPEGTKHFMKVLPVDVYSELECVNQDWEKHNIEFTVTAENTEVTLALYMWATKPLVFDNFVLKETDTPTGLIKSINKKERIVLYPNPATEIIHLKSERAELREAQIYNISGILVMNVITNDVINISKLKPGVYILKIEDCFLKFVKI